MIDTGRTTRFVLALGVCLLLSACPSRDDEGDGASPTINVTSLGNVNSIETSDLSIRLVGTTSSNAEVTVVSWKNDRGGNGSATGTENWATGHIVLQIGLNNISITAKDSSGNSSSKRIAVNREAKPNGTATDVNKVEPVVMYSYSSDLSQSAPLANASIDPGPVFVFLRSGDDWHSQGLAQVDYDCCNDTKNLHSALDHPWNIYADLSALQAGSQNMTVTAHFKGSSSADVRAVNFTIGSGDPSGNRTPTILGVPVVGATVGMEYSFLPTSADADGDSMGFSIENKPEWADFDPLTGRLYGFPRARDVGMHGDIKIFVTDGRHLTAMAPFSIRVDAYSGGSVTLSWIPPDERVDNSQLTDLAGYEILYGPVSGNFANSVIFDDPTTTRAIVDNLAQGEWKFVITAYDSNYSFSTPSNEISTTLQ